MLRILKKSRLDLGNTREKVSFLTREEARHLLAIWREHSPVY